MLIESVRKGRPKNLQHRKNKPALTIKHKKIIEPENLLRLQSKDESHLMDASKGESAFTESVRIRDNPHI